MRLSLSPWISDDLDAGGHAEPGELVQAAQADGGVGPRVGVELKAPLGGKLSFSGGLDASYLIGTLDYEKNTNSGSEDRKVASVGGFAGIDYAISENVTLGIQYKYMQLNGASVDDQEFFGTFLSGSAENVMQGFGVSFQMNF